MIVTTYYESLAKHVENLLKYHKIEREASTKLVTGLTGVTAMDCGAYHWRRCVMIPEINSEEEYFGAMHEIGHIVHPQGLIGVNEDSNHNYNTIMVLRECAAWEWCVNHCKMKLLKNHWKEMAELYRSYLVVYGYALQGVVLNHPMHKKFCTFHS